MLKKIFHRQYITPLVIATCLAPFITGMFMFFNMFKGSFAKELHEWAGMIMIIIAIAHIIGHWPSFKIYLKGKRLWTMTMIFAVFVPLFFAFEKPLLNDGQEKITPRYFVGLVVDANMESFASFSGLDKEEIEQKLSAAGIQITNPDESLGAIAQKNGKSIFDFIQIVTE